jgi:hypothetical protein
MQRDSLKQVDVMKNKFSYALAVILIFFGACWNAKLVFAWGGSTHPVIARDAYEAIEHVKFPTESTFFLWTILISYTQEPDKYNRVQNHLSAPECAWRLKSLSQDCIKAIKNDGDWTNIMLDLGKATHYIQDMNCPHHGIEKYKEGDHEFFEKRAVYGFWEKEKFDGFHEIADLEIFVLNAARFSRRFIKFDNSEFYNNPDYYQKVMEPLWTHTVNDVIDLWLTVFYQGLGEQRYNEIGFPKKLGNRDSEKLDFPDVQLAKD